MDSTGENQVAWVTGGSSGIGLAIAKTLGELGASVVITGRDQARLEAARVEMAGLGFSIDIERADVSNRSQVNTSRDWILNRYGKIDILVNNAGFNSRKRKWDELIPEEFDDVIAVNMTGAFNVIYAVLPTMRERKQGLIINISSVAGKQVHPDAGVAYTIAKHGVYVMSQSLNESELKNGIRTCVVAPGYVDTPAHAWRPQALRSMMSQPEDVARAVRFAVETPPQTSILEIVVWPGPR